MILLNLVLNILLVQVCIGRKLHELHDTEGGMNDELKGLKQNLATVTKQLLAQQFFTEERIRSEGSSGIKQVRVRRSGVKTYQSDSHIGYAAAAIHNHANNIRTVGLGEFVAVLNGVEFRTRHNDYRLYEPSKTSKEFHATDPIEFPEVPPAVTVLKNVSDQIEEMREWFKAWRDQDPSKRDYRKYFKPILCYLEGSWTTSGETIDEPFNSDRHFIDAKSWQDLHDRTRYTSYTGSKSRLENLAFLPTKIMSMINDSIPLFAQWNYRILCKPLKNDVPLKKFRIVDDLGARMNHRKTILKHEYSRAARFILDPDLDPQEHSDRTFGGRTYLDTLMEQIPGKNNIGELYDTGLDGSDQALDMETGRPLDVSKYHRWFRIGKADAMGLEGVRRFFSDEGVFAAMTTQERVPGLEIENRKKCSYDRKLKKRVCQKIRQKWTWAVPLEIIFLSPLSRWNPYKLVYKGDARGEGKAASFRKNGNCKDKSLQFDGTNSKAYFLTPDEFFSGSTLSKDTADTSRDSVCVLGPDGESKKVRASGTYVFLPNIKGVGALRQRYPIMPIHGEGSSIWKELDAVKDMVLNPELYKHMRWDSNKLSDEDVEFRMINSASSAVSAHTHSFALSPAQMSRLHAGISLQSVITSVAAGHSHTLDIRYDSKNKKYRYTKCSGYDKCRDGHPFDLIIENEE